MGDHPYDPDNGDKIETFDQYTRLDDDGQVANGKAAYFGINFCVEDEHNRGVGIGVIAQDEWSAFNTMVCGEDSKDHVDKMCIPGGNGVLDCGGDGNDDDACIDDRDQPFNNIDIPAGPDAKRLLIVGVIGAGGGTNGNTFNLYAK